MSPSQDHPSLLPPPATAPTLSPASRSKLQARRYLPRGTSPTPSAKAKGKQRADPTLNLNPLSDEDDDVDVPISTSLNRSGSGSRGRSGREKKKEKGGGRRVTVIFTNESEASGGGNLDIWVEDGETVAAVKERIRHMRPPLQDLTLRLIHSGRLLTDGIILLPWLRQLEERVKRQAAGMGGDVENVLKDVGLGDGDDDEREGGSGDKGKEEKEGKVWLHCNVGGKIEVQKKVEEEEEAEPALPSRRRGFDALLDAGLSPAEVAQMRRQFYESRGEEVPEGMDLGDVNDEHARALEEQWIEGDLTAETATTSTEGLYTSILQGLLTGFLLPLTPLFFSRELPQPNFFDADAEADGDDESGVSGRVAGVLGGGESPGSVVFGKRMLMGILLGTVINIAFGALRFLN